MYYGIMKALGPVQNKTTPLKSSPEEIITDRDRQIERWVEHYSNLHSIQNIDFTSAIDAIDSQPTMGELDAELTLENLRKAIDSLASGKAPGRNGIPRPDEALQNHLIVSII